METKNAIQLAGSSTALARLLGISISAVSQWGELVPDARVWQMKAMRPEWFVGLSDSATPPTPTPSDTPTNA
jgi:hypothetical protein